MKDTRNRGYSSVSSTDYKEKTVTLKMEGGRRLSDAYAEFRATHDREIESLSSNTVPEAAPSTSNGRNLITNSDIDEPTPNGYRRRRYNSLAELYEDFERDRIPGPSFRSTAAHATGIDRRSYISWCIGETSSGQNNQRNQMTHDEPMMERWRTTSSSANLGAGQPISAHMWVEDNRVPVSVDQTNSSGWNMSGFALRQSNPGIQMRHVEPVTGSWMAPTSSANPEQVQRSSSKRKAPEEFSVNPSYRASSSGSQLPENAWGMSSGSYTPSVSSNVQTPVTSMFQHNTPVLLNIHQPVEHIESSYRNIRLRTNPSYQQDSFQNNLPGSLSLTIRQPVAMQAYPVTGRPQMIGTNTHGVRQVAWWTDQEVSVSSISPFTSVVFSHQQLGTSSGSGSGGQTLDRNIQPGDMASQQMADPNILVQLQQHPLPHHAPYLHAHQNQNPNVHPDPHYPNHVPVYGWYSYNRRTVRRCQDALPIDEGPLPVLGTPEANFDNDEVDAGHVEPEEVGLPHYRRILRRERDGTVWLELNNMSYEEMVHIREQMRNIEIGLTEEDVAQHLKRRRHPSLRMGAISSEVSPCCICQEEFSDGEEIGMLECGHDFHSGCISRWLLEKNVCPICRSKALITGR